MIISLLLCLSLSSHFKPICEEANLLLLLLLLQQRCWATSEVLRVWHHSIDVPKQNEFCHRNEGLRQEILPRLTRRKRSMLICFSVEHRWFVSFSSMFKENGKKENPARWLFVVICLLLSSLLVCFFFFSFLLSSSSSSVVDFLRVFSSFPSAHWEENNDDYLAD